MRLFTSPWLAGAAAPGLTLLVITTVFGTLSMHVVVPVLPAVAREFDVSAGSIQLTISLYLVGVAIGQLIYGPLSDRFGRRPILIVGLAIYSISMTAAAFAPGLGILLVARACQALGGSCALVMGRAMVRDGAESSQAAVRMATLGIALSITPAVAPLVGAYVSAWFGWRMIFGLLAIATAILFAIVLATLPETNRNKTPLPGLGPMLASYASLTRSRRFVGYAIGGASSTSFYAFLSASPFIFSSVLGRSPQETGILYLLTLVGFTVGSIVAMRLATKFRGRRLAQTGNQITICGPVLMLWAYTANNLNIWTFMLPMMLFTIGAGLAGPFAQAGAVGADPKRIGAASGLYGFTQMAIGATCSLIVGAFDAAPVLPMILIMLVASLIGQTAYRAIGAEQG